VKKRYFLITILLVLVLLILLQPVLFPDRSRQYAPVVSMIGEDGSFTVSWKPSDEPGTLYELAETSVERQEVRPEDVIHRGSESSLFIEGKNTGSMLRFWVRPLTINGREHLWQTSDQSLAVFTRLEPPVFSLPSKIYPEPFNVAVTSPERESLIEITINGKPYPGGPMKSKASISVESGTRLVARTVLPGYLPSLPAYAEYGVGAEHVLVPGGNLLWYNQPASEFYQGVQERTYISWLTSEMEVQVSFYDHKTKAFEKPATLRKWERLDDHGAPSMLVLKEEPDRGKLLLSYSLHNSPLYLIRSLYSEDTSAWEPEKMIDEGPCTYPRLLEMQDGSLLIIYRKRVDAEEGLKKRTETLFAAQSNDNGLNWTKPVKLLDVAEGAWVYAGPLAMYNGQVFLAYSLLDEETGLNRDVWFVRYTPGSGSYVAPDGTNKPLPIPALGTQRIAETDDGQQAQIWDVKASADGTPIIAWMLSYQDKTEAWAARWTGEWVTSRIAEGAKIYYPSGIVLDGQDSSRAALSVLRGEVSEIEEWVTPDGGRTWRMAIAYSTDSPGHQFRPQYVKNAGEQLRLLWLTATNYSKWTAFETDLHAMLMK
jgi:hypothetical protein